MTKPKRPSFQHHINKRCVCTSFIFVLSLSPFLLHLHYHRYSRSISDTFHNFSHSLNSLLLWDALYSSHSIVALSLSCKIHFKHHRHKQHWESVEKWERKERSLCCVEPEKNVSSSRYSCINSGSSLAKQVEVNHEKSPLLFAFLRFFPSLSVLEEDSLPLVSFFINYVHRP